MKCLCRVLVVVCLLAGPVSAQESPADLIAKLGSRSYTDRERAANALEKLGRDVVPLLRDAMRNKDLEMRRRALLVIERIEDRLTLESIITPTPIRLECVDRAITDALADIQNETGLRFGIARSGEEPRTLDSGTLPFWQAWRVFNDKAKLRERGFAQGCAKLRRIDEPEQQNLLSLELEGPGRFQVPPIEFAEKDKDIRYAVDDRHSVRVRVKWHELNKTIDPKKPHAVFAVEVRPEPRLEVVRYPRVELVKLIDRDGKPQPIRLAQLVPPTSHAETAAFLAGYTGEVQFGGLLHLKALEWDGPPRTLKELHGKVHLTVLTHPPLIEIPKILKAAGREARGPDGISIRVIEGDAGADGEVQIRVRLDDLASLAPKSPKEAAVRVRPGVIALRGAIDIAIERLSLFDAHGRRHPVTKSRYEPAARGTGHDVALTFTTPGIRMEEMTLVLSRAPREIPVELPFTVKDVLWLPAKE